MKRKRLSTNERYQIYAKYGGRCAYCGQPITYKKMQVEHREPLALGGEDSMGNYMPSCNTCNHYKHTLTVEKFREQIGLLTERLREQVYIYKLALRHGRITENKTPVKFYFEKISERATAAEYLKVERHSILRELHAKLDEALYHEPADSGSEESKIWNQVKCLFELLSEHFEEGE